MGGRGWAGGDALAWLCTGPALPGSACLCPARGAKGAVDVVVGDTDYQSFAILYLEQARRLSVKLYGASGPTPGSAHTRPVWGGPGEPRCTQALLTLSC